MREFILMCGPPTTTWPVSSCDLVPTLSNALPFTTNLSKSKLSFQQHRLSFSFAFHLRVEGFLRPPTFCMNSQWWLWGKTSFSSW